MHAPRDQFDVKSRLRTTTATTMIIKMRITRSLVTPLASRRTQR
jgi:hypothetical protein